MTLQQLRYIVALDEYRHFGKAAEACGLTQSTLSLMIKKLEDELDAQIFNRDAHPVAPTETGQRVLNQARVVLYNSGQIPEIVRNEKDLLAGPLRIGLISTVAPVLVPGLFKHFGREHPEIALQTEEMLTETLKAKLHKADLDIGINESIRPDFNVFAKFGKGAYARQRVNFCHDQIDFIAARAALVFIECPGLYALI